MKLLCLVISITTALVVKLEYNMFLLGMSDIIIRGYSDFRSASDVPVREQNSQFKVSSITSNDNMDKPPNQPERQEGARYSGGLNESRCFEKIDPIRKIL